MSCPVSHALLALVLLPAVPAAAQVAIIHVDRDATGAATGASWADAFTDLQDGLAAAEAWFQATGSYSQVWVAAGTYTPAGPAGPRTASFRMPTLGGLYGGFAGHETSFADRDPAAHPTILSGDLQGDDQSNWVNHGNNAYHVIDCDGQWLTAIVDGFTILGGFANDAIGGHASGGAVRALSGAPTLIGCTITGNFANSGAAVVIGGNAWGHLTSIRDCTFSANLAQPYRAGAVYVAGGAHVELLGCDFLGNRTQGFSSPADGGAVFIEAGAAVEVRDCRFLGNASVAQAVGMFEGGALCNLSDGLVLRDCLFAGNSAETGGGVWNAGDVTIGNCLFSANTAAVGGGLLNVFNTATLEGCTFWGNSAGDGGGLANSYSPLVRVLNCVLWGNLSPGQPTVKAQIHNLDGATAEVQWSLVQALFETIPGEDPPDPADFPGCLDAHPLFADADGADNLAGTGDDDLSLAAGSPARDAGRNDFVPAGVLADASGAVRFHDDPLAADTGHGSAPLVDMGALEGGAPRPWTVHGGGTPSGAGPSVLHGAGSLLPGSSGELRLTHAVGLGTALLFVSTDLGAAPFKGGVLVAYPPMAMFWFWLDATGTQALAWSAWPPSASGLTVAFQYGIAEPSAPKGVSLSNGLSAQVP